MKKGWEYKKLGDVISHLRTGLNPRTHFKLNTPDAECYYITVRELKGFAIEPDEKTDKVNSAAIKRINERSNLKIGDVLFSGTGTIGKTALVSELPENWNIKEGVYVMTPKYSELDSKYFIFYIGSEFFLRLVNDKAAGTGVRSIPMKELVKLPIPVPPLPEQQRIVSYLDAAFAKIDAMKANAENALKEAKALFQASLKEMMQPKPGWEEKKLGDIALVRIGPFGSLLHKKDYISGGIPLVNPIHMIEGKIVANKDFSISNEKAKELSNYLLEAFDIVFARRGEVGRCAIVSKNEVGFLCGTGSLFVRFKVNVDYDFMLFLFQSVRCKNYLEHNASGTTMLNINASIIEKMPLTIPPLCEQQSIVAALDAIKSRVDRLQSNFDAISRECDALKQAILREVFE